MTDHRQYYSHAWLLRGLSTTAKGRLTIKDDRLSLTIPDSGQLWGFQLRKLEKTTGVCGLANDLSNGDPVTIFDVPVNEAGIMFPWYTFSGGMNVHIGKARYRISFGEQARTTGPARNNLSTIRSMRTIGQQWKSVLSEAATLPT